LDGLGSRGSGRPRAVLRFPGGAPMPEEEEEQGVTENPPGSAGASGGSSGEGARSNSHSSNNNKEAQPQRAPLAPPPVPGAKAQAPVDPKRAPIRQSVPRRPAPDGPICKG